MHGSLNAKFANQYLITGNTPVYCYFYQMKLEGNMFGPRSGPRLAYHYTKTDYVKASPKKLQSHINYV